MARDITLPPIPALPSTSDPELKRFLSAVKQRLEIYEGSRGNENSRVIKYKDLIDLELI